LHGTAAERATLTSADVAVGDRFYETDTGDRYRVIDVSSLAWVRLSDPIRDTLANLQGLGSDDGIAVGQKAIVTDHDYIEATCSAVDGGGATSTWVAYQRRSQVFAWTDGGAALRFPAWATLDSEVGTGSITAPQSSMNIDMDGVVLGVSFISIDTANLNTVTWGVHLDENTTPEETDVLECDTAGARYDFTFSTEFSAASNKRLHVSVTSDNARGQCIAKVHYKVDLLSGPFA